MRARTPAVPTTRSVRGSVTGPSPAEVTCFQTDGTVRRTPCDETIRCGGAAAAIAVHDNAANASVSTTRGEALANNVERLRRCRYQAPAWPSVAGAAVEGDLIPAGFQRRHSDCLLYTS